MKKIGGIALIIIIAIIGSGISRANNSLEMMTMYSIIEDAPDYDLEDHCKEIEVDESGYMEDEITVISGTHPSNAAYEGSDLIDDIVKGKSSNSSYDYYDDEEDYEYDMYDGYYDYLDDSEYDLNDYYYIDNDEYLEDGWEYDYDEYLEDYEYWDEDEEWYDEDDEYYYDEYDWYE